ncbi:hypothetical protein ACFOLF_24280 [Paenibacillus sepulcri]|uniref:RCK N-terminal domain-containing protein n=1 Tax=Paenibacillus sepulcri TaxID=359917 RepID=A0ABS7BW16_9BACL|nr:hypothetical protein [Paenibacillus sepulcri]
MEQRPILVAASTEAGRKFVRLLLYKQQPVVALTNNRREEKLLRELGVNEIIRVNTTRSKAGAAPQFSIGRVYIFESSLPLSCQYLQLMANWSCQEITVITTVWHPEVIYKKLGAAYIVRTQSGDVGFLLSRLNDQP